jgi:hypothetical protein
MKRNEKRFILIKFVIPLIISCLGMAFIIFFYSPFFSTNKVSHYFLVSKNVGIDFFGFILPLITIIFCTFIYLKQRLSKLAFALCFFCCLLIAGSLIQVTNIGLISNPAIFSFLGSMLILFVLSTYSFILKKAKNFQVNYRTALLLSVICVPSALIIFDIVTLPNFTLAIMGGYGLADGVLLSVLYSPLTLTFMFSILSIAYLAINQISSYLIKA